MSLFSTNRCKSLSAEYVEESYKAVNEAPDVSEPNDATVNDSEVSILVANNIIEDKVKVYDR